MQFYKRSVLTCRAQKLLHMLLCMIWICCCVKGSKCRRPLAWNVLKLKWALWCKMLVMPGNVHTMQTSLTLRMPLCLNRESAFFPESRTCFEPAFVNSTPRIRNDGTLCTANLKFALDFRLLSFTLGWWAGTLMTQLFEHKAIKKKATFHTVIQYCMSSLSSSFHMFIFFNPKQRKKKIVRPLARSNELWAMKYLGLHCHFFSPWHDGHQRRMCFHLTVSKMSIALKVKEVPLLGLFLSVSPLKARQTFVTWSYSIKFLSTTELSQSYSEVRYMESMLNEEDDKQSRTPPPAEWGDLFQHADASQWQQSVCRSRYMTWNEMKEGASRFGHVYLQFLCLHARI